MTGDISIKAYNPGLPSLFSDFGAFCFACFALLSLCEFVCVLVSLTRCAIGRSVIYDCGIYQLPPIWEETRENLSSGFPTK